MPSETKSVGRPASGRDDCTARIDRALYGKAVYVARSRGVSVAEYLTAVARPTVDRDFREAGKRLES